MTKLFTLALTFAVFFSFSTPLFSQETASDSVTEKKTGRWLQDPYKRYGFEANYSSICKHNIDIALTQETASTICNSLSFGVETQYKYKVTPIFHIGLGTNIGYTLAYDNTRGFNFQIRLPEEFGDFQWKYAAQAYYAHPKFLFGGSFSVPERGKRLRLSWEGSVGHRFVKISRDVFTCDLFRPSPGIKGDRWYEKGKSFGSYTISGGIRANYFLGHHWDLYTQLNVGAVFNQTAYALRESFDYEEGKKGGIGGVISFQFGTALSIDGFANFYHPSIGQYSLTHLRELEEQAYLDSVARAEGIYTGIMVNDGAEITRDASGSVNLLIFYKKAEMMMISNTPDFAGGKWEKYDGTKPVSVIWILPAGNGEKTIFVKFRMKDGTETGAYSDSILLVK